MSDMVKCEKCGKMFDGRGIKMHMNFCKGTEEKEDHKKEDQKTIEKEKSTKVCIECGSENVLRVDQYAKQSGKDFDKKAIYKLGYTHVCVDCGDILK